MNSAPPLPVSREMAIWRPVGITSVLSSGANCFSVTGKIKYVSDQVPVSLTLDVFVVSAVSAFLTKVETFLLTRHKRPNGNAVLFAHHTLGRSLVYLIKSFEKKILYFPNSQFCRRCRRRSTGAACPPWRGRTCRSCSLGHPGTVCCSPRHPDED